MASAIIKRREKIKYNLSHCEEALCCAVLWPSQNVKIC